MITLARCPFSQLSSDSLKECLAASTVAAAQEAIGTATAVGSLEALMVGAGRGATQVEVVSVAISPVVET